MEGESQIPVLNSLHPAELTSNPLVKSEGISQLKMVAKPAKNTVVSPMSPRRRRALERESMIEKVRHMVSSPFPYMILILLVVMIIMIFVDIMPIAGKSTYIYKITHYAYFVSSKLS